MILVILLILCALFGSDPALSSVLATSGSEMVQSRRQRMKKEGTFLEQVRELLVSLSKEVTAVKATLDELKIGATQNSSTWTDWNAWLSSGYDSMLDMTSYSGMHTDVDNEVSKLRPDAPEFVPSTSFCHNREKLLAYRAIQQTADAHSQLRTNRNLDIVFCAARPCDEHSVNESLCEESHDHVERDLKQTAKLSSPMRIAPPPGLVFSPEKVPVKGSSRTDVIGTESRKSTTCDASTAERAEATVAKALGTRPVVPLSTEKEHCIDERDPAKVKRDSDNSDEIVPAVALGKCIGLLGTCEHPDTGRTLPIDQVMNALLSRRKYGPPPVVSKFDALASLWWGRLVDGWGSAEAAEKALNMAVHFEKTMRKR